MVDADESNQQRAVADRDADPVSSDAPGLRSRPWELIAYVLLSILLIGIVRPPLDATAYEFGRSIGLLLMSVLVAYGIWSLIRRARGSNAKWSPWLILIACFAAAFFKVLVAGGDAPLAEQERAASIEVLTEDEVFEEIPGLRYGPVPPRAMEQIEQAYLTPEARESIVDVAARVVLEGRRQVGVVSAVFSTPEAAASDDFAAGFFEGFTDSIEEQGGGPVTPVELGNGTAQGGPSPQGFVIAFMRGNAAITVIGGDRRTAEMIANALQD